ncbi:RimK family alpha-L-glutamate ligase [Herbaspirillum sp. SJZ107]|uniref:ATP-grasp domain-containing protein n=1 Tax=Herbaspirillum sp. SJZ107 TaxID=2572881 RepID=UPI001151A541|nr:glutathione synthase [Herbaspirillum sp. SJZ107]TQK01273.1 RimK-like ATP-grasp domain-containing protein [Herbaspirillum sp. SJZ107]
MILLAGIASEPPIALAADSAAALGIECVLLNQRAFAHDDIEFEYADGRCRGALTSAGQVYPLECFSGIYLRTIDAASLPELSRAARAWDRERTEARTHAWAEILTQWAEVAPQRVANRLSATLSNFSKPYQLQVIRAAGFAVPETIVTNDPAAVHAFNERHRRVIYKSTSSVRSIVRMLDDAALAQLDRVRALPTQFQQFIDGENVRVHVVGDAVFAARIVSEAVDYRYAGRDGLDVDMLSFQPPDDIVERCRVLARNLALPFCGIDFKVRPGGQYVCFEVNPSPAYSYYQMQTASPISDALVRYLAGQA